MKMRVFLVELPLLLGLTGVPALAQSSSLRPPPPPFFQVLDPLLSGTFGHATLADFAANVSGAGHDRWQ